MKNIQKDEFSEIDFDVINSKSKEMVDIYNVDNEDYAILNSLKEEVVELMNKFNKHDKKPLNEFKETFVEYLIK